MLTAGRQAGAQPRPDAKRVAFLAAGKADGVGPYRAALVAGLRERGWIEGSNLVIEIRFAEGDAERAARLSRELLALQPDVFLSTSDAYATTAARLSSTVPIVFVLGFDPVGQGLVKSLAQPGANVTGFSVFNDELVGKRLSLLKQTVPDVRKVGMMVREGDGRARAIFEATQALATRQAIVLAPVIAGDRDGIAPAIAHAAGSGVTALIAAADPLWLSERRQIVEACLRHRLPASFGALDFAYDGLLMSYSPAFVPMFLRTAEVVDRILRGASPATIPVEQATNFEFVINLKTARALGIKVPQAVLLQATRLVE